MTENPYFERLCSDVYGYYGNVRNVDPKRHSLVMLRSMGEFWTEEDVRKIYSERPEGQEFLSFTEFRRLAKSRWYEPPGEDEENEEENEDGYGNQLYMHAKDIRNFEKAFNRVSKFYGGNKGNQGTIPADVLYNLTTNFDDPMPPNVANHLVSSLHVYNNAVSARSLLCLLGRREKVQNVL